MPMSHKQHKHMHMSKHTHTHTHTHTDVTQSLNILEHSHGNQKILFK